MKTGQIILLAIVFIAFLAGAFFLGKSLPNGDLRAEVKILRETIKEQNEVIVKMDSTLLLYKEKMMEFVIDFDTFRVKQEISLKKLSSSVRGGREFQEWMFVELSSLSQKRDSLSAEALKYSY